MNEVDYIPHRYSGNGVTKDFPFNWKVFKDTDLIIKFIDSEGNEEIKELATDYTANIEEVGGNVIFNVAPEAGITIVIARNVSDYQSTGYSTSTGFQGIELEKSFDRVSCNLQEMEYNIETFKTEFSTETNQKIEDNKADTDQQIEDLTEDVNTQIDDNKTETDTKIDELTASVNQQIADNKTETDNKIQDFKDEVNEIIQDVSEAAQKLNRLDEILVECEGYATNANNSAINAGEESTISQREAIVSKGFAEEAEQCLITFRQELIEAAIPNIKISTLTLGTEWTGEKPCIQEVEIEGIKASDVPAIILKPEGTYEEQIAQINQFAQVFRATTSEGKITFFSKKATTLPLTLQMQLINK